MQGDFSLDDLIQKERDQKKKQRSERINATRTKRIQKHFRRERDDRHHRDNRDHRDFRPERHHHRQNREYERQRPRFQDRFQDRNTVNQAKRQDFNGCTLLVKGFVADVSTEDIYKLLKGKKVHKISTFLENEERNELVYSKDMGLDVKIKFQKKEDADAFMEEYGNKVLDGKHTLTFTFTRS